MRYYLKKLLSKNLYTSKYTIIKKYLKTLFLSNKRFYIVDYLPVWQPNASIDRDTGIHTYNKINIFGIEINEETIDWHKDYYSGYFFPLIKFNKINIQKLSNKGIDVKFPWELSRFVFALNLAAGYIHTNDEKYYIQYKKLISDWIEKNPFLYGINWKCTMDVAIRAISWILSANVFYVIISHDSEFLKKLSTSLVKHAEYISNFPEIYPDNHTTNHTTADYIGLLFLSVALNKHPKSDKWQKQAIDGILKCMDYQVYDDGGSFEASTSYHRLVTELNAMAAILSIDNKIILPDWYYKKLFKMFEFVASILDKNGNAPLIGDNDSGTILQSNYQKSKNYAYLPKLGEIIFNYRFGTYSDITELPALSLLPEITTVKMVVNSITPKSAGESRYFQNSGLCILKNKNLSCVISIMSIGQNGYGGHNHYDCGSFTVSYNGNPLVVDPGTYTYTRNYEQRNKFRSYQYHNTVIPSNIEFHHFNFEKLFATKEYFNILNEKFTNNLSYQLKFQLYQHYDPIKRKFFIEENNILIEDELKGEFIELIHLSPEVIISEINNYIVRTNFFDLHLSNCLNIEIEEYKYSIAYNLMKKSSRIKLFAENKNKIKFCLINS